MAEKFFPARRRVHLTPGRAVRIVREWQEMSQNDLAESTGLPQPVISAIENDREGLGIERATKLARALKVHPSVLAFPDWEAAPAAEQNAAGARPGYHLDAGAIGFMHAARPAKTFAYLDTFSKDDDERDDDEPLEESETRKKGTSRKPAKPRRKKTA
jgi:transcriptional regulator with XRE-family HTH domain